MPPSATPRRAPVAAPPRRNGLLPVAAALAAGSLAVALAGEDAGALLRYERARVQAGEAWRLLTAHLAHLGAVHLALNAAGMALVALLLGRQWRAGAWAALTAACALGVTLGLLAFSPSIAWYVGASGLVHGWAAAGAVALARRRERAGLAWLLALAGKLAWEQAHGAGAASALIGGATVVDAHLYGALAGAGAALALRPRPRGP